MEYPAFLFHNTYKQSVTFSLAIHNTRIVKYANMLCNTYLHFNLFISQSSKASMRMPERGVTLVKRLWRIELPVLDHFLSTHLMQLCWPFWASCAEQQPDLEPGILQVHEGLLVLFRFLSTWTAAGRKPLVLLLKCYYYSVPTKRWFLEGVAQESATERTPCRLNKSCFSRT